MSPDPLAPPPRQTPDPGPKSVPVLVEPIDPAEVPATSTPAPRAPDVVQPRRGLARWAREHKWTVLGVGGGLLALCLVLLIVLPRLGSGDNADRRPSDEEDEDGSPLAEKPQETVFGTVKYGGKTVPVGTIMFHPEKGRGAVVEIQNGKYRTDRVPAGPVTVTVSTTQMRRTYKAVEQQRKSGQPAPGGGLVSAGGKVPQLKDKLKDKQPPEMPRAAELAKTQDKAWENIKDMIDVPEKFEDPEKSELKFEIKSGSQEIPIDLPKVEGFKPKK